VHDLELLVLIVSEGDGYDRVRWARGRNGKWSVQIAHERVKWARKNKSK